VDPVMILMAFEASERRRKIRAGIAQHAREGLTSLAVWWAALLVIAVLGGVALILAGFAGR